MVGLGLMRRAEPRLRHHRRQPDYGDLVWGDQGSEPHEMLGQIKQLLGLPSSKMDSQGTSFDFGYYRS